jgi:hypothetical protein
MMIAVRRLPMLKTGFLPRAADVLVRPEEVSASSMALKVS